ncbi:hypothetical protein PHYPSEUDO_001852 [Phytophthora pseudosyringae]|uniref:Uncharacterized protein n=1 Tax=Phytophthora pseudosyringae TaxID=221518 RepID=A0A8T1VYU3_9STRA|nr:hypothetical protein PHYPSEUDO_001852 [Phytophthora pseudosyringae]
MDDAATLAAPAAAQISQADIIERQAETIARLQRQVERGSEYKQLTKAKLKEAAARLKEYRVRVETLLREEKALQRRLTEASKAHDKTKQQHKIAAVKAKKHTRHAVTQTAAETTKVTRSSQTQLSGQVERVNKKKTTADSAVQTVDTIASTRKRGRASTQTVVDQLVPKLSRHSPLGGRNETPEDATPTQQTTRQTWTPLQPLGSTTFAHETSAALDAELAFSDSDEESGDTLEILESGETGGAETVSGFDAAVLSEIDKELEFSSDEEEEAPRPAAESETGGGSATKDMNGKGRTADVALLRAVDAVVQSEIDKELETSSDEDDEGPTAERRRTIGAGSVGNVVVDTPRTGTEVATADSAGRLQGRGLDAAVSNDIDKKLETSSDEEDVEDSRNVKKAGQIGLVSGAGGGVADSSRALVSIDDELDDEFAALDADSEPEHHEEQKTANGSKDGDDSSSSSSSSDSNSSDSSDTDSDEDRDDPMTGTSDKAPTGIAATLSLGPAAEKEAQVDLSGERGAAPPSTDTNPVVLTTPVEKKAVTVSEDVYSPVVAGQLPSQTPEPLQLDTSATAAAIRSKDEEEPNVAVASQPCPVQNRVPTPSSPTKTAAGNAIDVAVSIGTSAPSNQTSSPRSPASKQPAVLTSSSKEDQLTASEALATSDSSQPSAPVPLDLAEPGELVRSPIAQAKRSSPDAQASEIRSPAEDTSLGRVRKADEANLDVSRAGSLQKKVKRDEISGRTESGREGKEPPVGAATGDSKVKKKPAVNVESKEERRMKKSLMVFKQAIVLGKGEEADNEYARRTIAVLVNQSSRFIDTDLVHVTTLCQVLADAFRELEVSTIAVVRGALGVFRTPRSRRLLQESKLGLSWLCNQVLLRLMCRGDDVRKQDAAVAPESLTLSLVHDCLLHLRGFLVEERASIGDFLPATKLQVPVATQQSNVSHDKVFLAHIIALHTHLCQSTGQLSRSRVLLFDIVRDNPNIRGLYLAMVMLEVYPAILEREFDQQLLERHVMLKETLQQALIVISGAAALREELLLHQSSITMLHRIADAIQMPELEEVDGTNPNLPRTYVEKLFSKLSPEDASPAVYFELAKCLEVCTAVYGLDLVTETFSIERCQELFSKADVDAKSGILSIVGHIAMAITPKTSDTQNPRTRGEQYVESVVDWLHQLLATETIDEKTSAEDRFKLCVRCSTVCVELILDYSAPAGLDARRRVLCEIVNWFDATPPDQLLGLPATFLRRLRLAVVAARPQVAPAAV